MFKQISYRKRLKLLGLSAIILLILCYRYSLSKSMAEYKLYKNITNSGNSKNDQEYFLSMLQMKEKMVGDDLNRFVLDTLNYSRNLLGVVSEYCANNDLKLKEYKPGPVLQSDSLRILTRVVTVEGNFVNCLKLIYNLETHYKVGRVSSVLFKSYANANNTNTFLNCTIYIQNLITDLYEKK